MALIDSHCHLSDRQFASDLPKVLDRAWESGIQSIVMIADSVEEARACLKLTKDSERLFGTAGVHPHHASLWKRGDEGILREILQSSPKMVAVGEIGLDYHEDRSPREAQRVVFSTQLSLAKDMGIPVVIHCREAVADVKEILDKIDPQKAVLHCCSEKWEDVRELVERGYLLSFTGIATYPSAEGIRRTIERCPLQQMMIETDAPYLAPIPHRGKRNEPAFVVEVAKCIAQIKGVSFEDVDRVTTANAVEFFSLMSS